MFPRVLAKAAARTVPSRAQLLRSFASSKRSRSAKKSLTAALNKHVAEDRSDLESPSDPTSNPPIAPISACKPIDLSSSVLRTDFGQDARPLGGLVSSDVDLEMSYHPDLYDPSVHLASAPTDWSNYEPSTPLLEELLARIAVAGRPISTAAYMQAALTHPQHGYYVQATSAQDDFEEDEDEDAVVFPGAGNIIGASGDFVTAPEVSSVFAEMLGVWLYTQWQINKPKSWQLVECGPGQGSLTADLVEFCTKLDSFGKSLEHIHLLEASPVFRQVQRERLQDQLKSKLYLDFGHDSPKPEGDARRTVHVHWHDSLAALLAWQAQNESKLPTFAICQEFLDALPVYQFEKTTEGWRERLVDVALREDMMDEDEREAASAAVADDTKKPRLRLVLAPQVTPALQTLLNVDDQGLLAGEDASANIGSVVEVNPEAILLIQDLAKMLEQQGGAALIVDYGQEGSTDSLRAFAKHQQVPFLSRPGQVDVTADVDFGALRHAVQQLQLNVEAFGPTTQGQFLVSMGIQERVVQVIEQDSTSDQLAEDLYDAMVRLVDPEQMGQRYKVLALARKKEGIYEPPGFDPTATVQS